MNRVFFIPIVVVAAAFLIAPCNAENFALVVGVNRCKDYVIGENPPPRPLAGAEENAKDFATLLKETYKFPAKNVFLLTGKEANYEAIKTKFEWLQHNLREQDQFVFYFTGHGTQVPDTSRDEKDPFDEALCTFDASVVNGQPERLIIDDELAEWLFRIKADRNTVVFDCCHAGTAAMGGPENIRELSAPGPQTPHDDRRRAVVEQNPWKEFQDISKGPHKTIVAFYACRADETAIERFFLAGNVSVPRGQFSKLLIDDLRNGKSDRLKDLSVSTKLAIDAWAKQNPELRQTPSFEPATAQNERLIDRAPPVVGGAQK